MNWLDRLKLSLWGFTLGIPHDALKWEHWQKFRNSSRKTLVKTKETIQRHIKTIKNYKNTHTDAEYAYKSYKNSPAPNQNIDKVTDIPDSHLASRGPFKGTGMLLRAQLGGRTSQETPSHHRQGADRRWSEVLIMLQSDIRYIYILHYIIWRWNFYYRSYYVLLFLFEISFLSLLVTVGCSCSAMLHAAHGSPYQCSQLITCGIRQALNDLNDPGITMLKILSWFSCSKMCGFYDHSLADCLMPRWAHGRAHRAIWQQGLDCCLLGNLMRQKRSGILTNHIENLR